MKVIEILRAIDEKTKRKFATAINYGLGADLDIPQWELELKTHNYKSGLRWDLINTSLMRDFDCDSVLFSIQKRGFFEFILMLHKPTNILFSFMKEDRLKEIIKSKPGETPHYYNALTMLNNDLKAQIEQLQIIPVQKFSFKDKQLSEMLNNLCHDLLEKKETLTCRHVIITFSSINKSLGSLKATILNSNFEIVDEESWNEFIPVVYEHDAEIIEIEDESEEEQEEISPEIKPEVLNRMKDFMTLKKQKDEKDFDISGEQ